MSDYDVAVIGAGPGGYVAAIRAAQLGMKTVIIEREHLGGVCLNWGCIPTKALLRNAEVAELVSSGGKMYGFTVDNVTLDYAAAVARSRQVSERLVKGVQALMKGNGIDIVMGSGKLVNSSTILVQTTDGASQTINATSIILATGSRARVIPGVTVDGERVLTAREALERTKLPESAIIIGAGPIGLEFATIWNAYGAKVTVVEMMDHVLPSEDEEAAQEMSRHLRRAKIDTLTSTRVDAVKVSGSGVNVQITGPKGEDTLEAEIALVAIGVRPNSEEIGLESVGIETNRGWVKVDGYMRTNVSNIYAIGDLNGLLPLAHVASAQALLAVETIAGHKGKPFTTSMMPRGTYTSPQVASFGLSEANAIAQGMDVSVGKFPFLANGKALGLGENHGFVKIVSNTATHEVVGAVIIGPEATELLPELVLAAKSELTPAEIAETVHAHPTLNEAIMEAAHSVFGKAIHNL
ncbi:MAG: dihydrolipoyl dehydrogenase [Anaerolineae bacterium]|nr:dihydrolipoyl dehydrogenase [Anaerolineae bacterium]